MAVEQGPLPVCWDESTGPPPHQANRQQAVKPRQTQQQGSPRSGRVPQSASCCTPALSGTSGMGRDGRQLLLQSRLQQCIRQGCLQQKAHDAATVSSGQTLCSLQQMRDKSVQLGFRCGSKHGSGWKLHPVASGALPSVITLFHRTLDMDSWLHHMSCWDRPVDSTADRKLRSSGCRGWRHHSLAEAWQGSMVASAPAVLHDLAVCTAEAVAQAYLGEVCRVLWTSHAAA